MQPAFCIAPPVISLVLPSRNLPSSFPKSAVSSTARFVAVKATNPDASSTVDYDSSLVSVFPAEACETVGGDACQADMYPEVKLPPTAKKASDGTSEQTVDREYLDYDQPKTVFRDEACDDLGGEFCLPESQSGA